MSNQLHNSQFTIHNSQLENPNLRVAALFVDSLANAGLDAVVISPGSRSTPLTLAFEAHPGIETFLHLDERGAGFYALGMALASDKPVALVCTSGTAVANYFPAIVEAQMSQVPLLILTGDRPHELRHSGANQTIDQVKIFGDHNLMNLNAARLVCLSLDVSEAGFYKAIADFKGASKRLELIASNSGTAVYKDFAHSPSKLVATVSAVQKQFPVVPF